MTDVRITKLARRDDFFTANVSSNGTTVRVDNSLGSWTATVNQKADPGLTQSRKEVNPLIARVLQKRLRSLLRGEKADETTVHVNGQVNGTAKAIADRVARAGAKAVQR
jgi:hypothetical protein